MSFFRFLSVLLLAAVFVSCTDDHWADYTPLERQLLIVWVAAEKQDYPVMEEYTAEAVSTWARLRRQPGEGEALRLMDLWMLGLRNAVANEQANGVHTHLRHLHNQLRGIRPEQGIEEPLNLIYGFDARWEEVEAISHDQLLGLLEWQEYEEAFTRAQEQWTGFQRFSPAYTEQTMPGLTGDAAAAEYAGLELTRALNNFERLLSLANQHGMAAASEEVRARFLAYLMVAVAYPTEDAAR